MTNIEKPTKLEEFSGNLLTQVGVTAIAAFSATPLAALLPLLANTLASDRHKQRVERALLEINETLQRYDKKIKNITDSQYKIINETILIILQTTEEEKIKFLKQVIENSINNEFIPGTRASQLSRIIRDISAEEIDFLNRNINYVKVVFIDETKVSSDLYVAPNSHDGTLAAGLISMGLLMPTKPTIDNIGSYQFSPLAVSLLEMLT